MLGTHFAVYDNGDSPRKGGRETMRRELVAVVYVSFNCQQQEFLSSKLAADVPW